MEFDLTVKSEEKAKEYFDEITVLIEKTPSLDRPGDVAKSQEWLADVHALVKASGDSNDADDLKTQVNKLIEYAENISETIRKEPALRIQVIAQRARAILKLKASG